MGYVVDGPIGKNPAKQVVETSKKGTNGFKQGGSCMKKGGQVMSSAHKGERPARAGRDCDLRRWGGHDRRKEGREAYCRIGRIRNREGAG